MRKHKVFPLTEEGARRPGKGFSETSNKLTKAKLITN